MALKTDLKRYGAARTKALVARDAASAELLRLIPEARASGLSVAEIAEITGLTRPGVYEFIRRARR